MVLNNERRKHKRFAVLESIAEPVEIHFPPPFYQQPISGKIVNICVGGIELVINEPIPQFFLYSFYIHLRGIKPFEAKGKVTRLEKDVNQYNVSICFTEIDGQIAGMLNLAVEDNEKCLKERVENDKNFCFEGCKFNILCSKENKLAVNVKEKYSEIDVKDIEKETMKDREENRCADLPKVEVMKEEVVVPEIPLPEEGIDSQSQQVPFPKTVIVKKYVRKNIHPLYYVFLGFIFIIIVGFFSKDKVTQIITANAEKKLILSKYESAVKNYKIILKYEPRNIDIHMKLADVYDKMNMYSDSEREYKEVLKINPGDFNAILGVGKLNIKLNNLKNASVYLKKAKSIMPQNQEAKIYLGICYEKNKKYDEALSEFSGVSADNPTLPAEACFSIGKVMGIKGFFKNAILFMNKANLLNSYSEYFEMGIINNETEPDTAIVNFIEAIAKKSDFQEAYEWLGLVYRRKGLYNVAIDSYLAALSKNPKSAKVFFNISQLYALKDGSADAIIYLDKAVSLDKTYAKLAKDSYEFSELKNNIEFKKILKKK